MTDEQETASVRLSEKYSVVDYRRWEAAQDKPAIALLFEQRFNERYLDPVSVDGHKNGFTMMAIGCLMIEALESFMMGWPDTKHNSQKAFRQFFARVKPFGVFAPRSEDFYKHVRCGILHQAETTGGWRILRKGPLLQGKTVNATIFTAALRFEVGEYAEDLRNNAWGDKPWPNFRCKMNYICANAEVK